MRFTEAPAPAQPVVVEKRHKPCVFQRFEGAGPKLCHETSSSPMRAVRCAEARCRSPWRACLACISQGGGTPDVVVDPKTGLCRWHTENGKDARRPSVVQREALYSRSSLPFAGPRTPRAEFFPEDFSSESEEEDEEIKEESTHRTRTPRTPSGPHPNRCSKKQKLDAIKKAAQELGGEDLRVGDVINRARENLKAEGFTVPTYGSFTVFMSSSVPDVVRKGLGIKQKKKSRVWFR